MKKRKKKSSFIDIICRINIKIIFEVSKIENGTIVAEESSQWIVKW